MPALAHCSCDVVVESRLGKAYNEEAFRYLLAIERARAARARRALLLVLVSLKGRPGMTNRISPAIAARIFSSLWLSVREVDFAGWWREDRVAGAVLALGTDSPGPDTPHHIGRRITTTLGERIAAHIASRLHVRVLHLRQY